MAGSNNEHNTGDDGELQKRFAKLSKSRQNTPIPDSDNLGDRFEKLFNKKPVALQDNTVRQNYENLGTADLDISDDLSLEDILDELGATDQQWILDSNTALATEVKSSKLGLQDRDTIRSLLEEAKQSIDQDAPSASIQEPLPEDKDEHGDEDDDSEHMNPEHFTSKDEQDVHDILEQVHASIKLSKSITGSDSPPAVEDDDPPPYEETDNDSDLMKRFAALQSLSLPPPPSSVPTGEMGLPLTPKNAPVKKGDKVPIQKKVDDMIDDIEHWCCICNEDAAYKCLGCEGDLYCVECFNDGHRGPGAGLDERKHKFMKYQRPAKT